MARIRRGLRHTHNWLQLVRFGVVGASGYVVNLTTFAICISALNLGHRSSAVIAFLVALTNNFLWNRRWTFGGSPGRAHRQATRFVVVSVVAFAGSFLVLELLVTQAGMPAVAAQAIAIVVATPLNFVGNKLWTFDT